MIVRARKLARERELMAPIRKLADMVIDTSRFNVHELRQFIVKRFQPKSRRPLMISVVSFGYRYGIPADADLVFDVRFLPNPHFVPGLRNSPEKIPRLRATSVRSADAPIPEAHGEFALVPAPALHPRGQKLSDHRSGMHRRPPPLGDDG